MMWLSFLSYAKLNTKYIVLWGRRKKQLIWRHRLCERMCCVDIVFLLNILYWDIIDYDECVYVLCWVVTVCSTLINNSLIICMLLCRNRYNWLKSLNQIPFIIKQSLYLKRVSVVDFLHIFLQIYCWHHWKRSLTFGHWPNDFFTFVIFVVKQCDCKLIANIQIKSNNI